MKKNFFLVLFFLLLVSCNEKAEPIISFYYWKTIFKLSETEKKAIHENDVRKIYIRYFDIDLNPKDENPIPLTPVRFQESMNNFEIVPVVYIKNKVMLKQNVNLDDLAQKTIRLITEINSRNKIHNKEIQVDCDWTLSSKDNYLKFIEILKKLSQKKLSVTIRLHQVKYFKKTKIPNADSGVLMYYNMGSIAPDTLNSIYDKKIAERYLKSLKRYPLHLNFALPIYSWAVHIRNQKVIGLRSKLNVLLLKEDKNFEQINSAFFKVKHSNYKNGVFYEENDLLKTESISSEDLKEMAQDLKENLAQSPNEIIFYDLDEFNIINYEKNIFKQVVSYF